MTYIDEFEQQLRDWLAKHDDEDRLVEWIIEQINRSYRSGLITGRRSGAKSTRTPAVGAPAAKAD